MGKSAKAIFTCSLARLPEPLRTQVSGYWKQFSARQQQVRWDTRAGEDCLHVLPRVWGCSEFAARTCLRYPQLLAELIDSGDLLEPYADGALALRARPLVAQAIDESDLKRRLRVLRRRETLRIAWRDLAGWADLSEVMASMSELADVCIDAALAWLYSTQITERGAPLGEQTGEPTSMVVLGLGKLGGNELNFSSDVDLIFAYPEQGSTAGRRPVSNHEFFLQLGRRLINVLSEATADGFVFRVDLRLRPNGNSGPLALGFDAMELYYQTHGREWERYALIKARVVAGDRMAGESLLTRLRPFVFRKYLDYGAVQAIREMKTLINRELQRKGVRNNIKLGPGGIREIEFIGQAFQLIRGGREPSLQQRSILPILEQLQNGGHLSTQTVADLVTAYHFLRKTENRLQMIADRQTHELPHEVLDHARLAIAMGFDNWPAFEAALRHHSDKVQQHFDQVFAVPESEAAAARDEGFTGLWSDSLDEETAHSLLVARGFDEPGDVVSLLRGLRSGPAYTAFSGEGRARMDQLMPLVVVAAGETDTPSVTLGQLIKVIEAIGRRSTYLVLLIENPTALSQLTRLCAASPWIANWISQNPVLLDELLDPVRLYAPPSSVELEQELRQRLLDVEADDLELQMEVLREFRHGHELRVAAADIGPGMAPEQVGVHLARIAEVVLRLSLETAHQGLVAKHGEPTCRGEGPLTTPGFTIIGYGKLGSLELGYGSDLDMIFLFETCESGGTTTGPRQVPHEVFFARLGQRLIHILTTRTRAGLLYEVDMRLRPSGRAGPLVTSLAAFGEYQRHQAWTWEHQALVRARALAGKHELCQAFARIRRELLCTRRDPAHLRQDVVQMRNKMLAAQPHHDAALIDVKHGRGGIVDIEFMVQYWVLLQAADHPELAEHTDNIGILQALADAGLLSTEWSELLVSAYRQYLSTEHRLKLTEGGLLVEHRELAGLADAVVCVWGQVFEQSSGSD